MREQVVCPDNALLSHSGVMDHPLLPLLDPNRGKCCTSKRGAKPGPFPLAALVPSLLNLLGIKSFLVKENKPMVVSG